MRIYRTLCLTLLMLALAGTLLAQTQKSSGYKVTRRITLGGEGGWDYLTLDSEAHRLYVARSTRVMVIDVDSGKQVGKFQTPMACMASHCCIN